ncbi:MAG TPA: VOC family protein [Longimicrobium sp.]|nr:VOC family protein [Longimicrobium sp.]
MPTIERVIPILTYANIPAAHEFLVNVLGFEAGGVYRDEQGMAVHGEVRAAGTAIWLHRVTDEHAMASPLTAPSSNGMVVMVDDVDAHHAHARAAGAQVESEPHDMPYGQREYGIRDPEGHRWWFAAPIPAAAARG